MEQPRSAPFIIHLHAIIFNSEKINPNKKLVGQQPFQPLPLRGLWAQLFCNLYGGF